MNYIFVVVNDDVKLLFGVALSQAVERSPCHDGIQLPIVVRECIDYIEEFGEAYSSYNTDWDP